MRTYHRNPEGNEMRQKPSATKSPSDRLVKSIRRGDAQAIAERLYYSWSKEFPEAGKRRLAGDTARAVTSGEVTDLRREARARRRAHGTSGSRGMWSKSSAKIDSIDCREDRLFAAGLGDIEKTIHPREVLEVLGPEAGKVEGQVLAPVFLEVTDKIFGDVYLS